MSLVSKLLFSGSFFQLFAFCGGIPLPSFSPGSDCYSILFPPQFHGSFRPPSFPQLLRPQGSPSDPFECPLRGGCPWTSRNLFLLARPEPPPFWSQPFPFVSSFRERGGLPAKTFRILAHVFLLIQRNSFIVLPFSDFVPSPLDHIFLSRYPLRDLYLFFRFPHRSFLQLKQRTYFLLWPGAEFLTPVFLSSCIQLRFGYSFCFLPFRRNPFLLDFPLRPVVGFF